MDAAIVSAVIAGTVGLTVIATYLMNRTKAASDGGAAMADIRARAEAAMYVAKEAKDKAEAAVRENSALELRVAREYASTNTMEKLETKLEKAIDRLGDRINEAISARTS